ncbi:PEP-CTERM sorting domain-containing protein [uncultured Paraglaciecola sp.]|uniref:PEP-CTERM sorting domain-containing protein n=1 Tax=uncultured Paraglaciecola sp. TaxID=1765024 RepID=UPI00261BE4DD|nr:PEP-CTERM sorting domain-containing protein [uncultured Paraglaciecola sp.]
MLSKLCAAALLLCASMASHSTVIFGEDLDPSSSNANSIAANASFLSQLVGVGTEDFESFSNNQSGPLVADFGVAGTATLSGSGEIVGDDGFGRFATSGTQFWETNENFMITFSNAISAFGFFGTDIGDFGGQITLGFEDGNATSLMVNNTTSAPDGALLFWGIIDTANPFTSVTFGNTDSSDYFGFDDLVIGVAEQVIVGEVPEPSAFLIFGLGIAGLALSRKQTKK